MDRKSSQVQEVGHRIACLQKAGESATLREIHDDYTARSIRGNIAIEKFSLFTVVRKLYILTFRSHLRTKTDNDHGQLHTSDFRHSLVQSSIVVSCSDFHARVVSQSTKRTESLAPFGEFSPATTSATWGGIFFSNMVIA